MLRDKGKSQAIRVLFILKRISLLDVGAYQRDVSDWVYLLSRLLLKIENMAEANS